jgi:hypothetical protein
LQQMSSKTDRRHDGHMIGLPGDRLPGDHGVPAQPTIPLARPTRGDRGRGIAISLEEAACLSRA